MPRSWERCADEPLDAYLAFLAYCLAPPAMRSVGMVAALFDSGGREWRSAEVLGAWEHRFCWKGRAASWDADGVRRRNDSAEPTPFDEMMGRHRKEALAFQQRVIERLRRLDSDELKPGAIARWFDVAVRVEKETHEASQGNDEGDRRREFLDRLLADPEACDLAGRLVERLASSGAFSGGAGVVGDAKSVDVGKTSGETRPPAG